MNIDKSLRVIEMPDGVNSDIFEVVNLVAKVAVNISKVISFGNLRNNLGKEVGENSDGDNQKALDIFADEQFLHNLRSSPVRYYASEEQEELVELNKDGSILFAIDPLDGSSNINTNVSIGTIFSLKRANNILSEANAVEALLSAGKDQLASGYIIYGPQTTLIFTSGQGVDEYILDIEKGCFVRCRSNIRIPTESAEYSINASNYRYWSKPMRAYIDDLNLGIEGPAGKNFNMRWVASLVAETHRILIRGGIFIYPGDSRKGYESGRLRMVYECAPIAFIIEQAGGGATDIYNNILSLRASELHGRTPFVFGSLNEVNRVQVYHELPVSEISPLLQKRGSINVQGKLL